MSDDPKEDSAQEAESPESGLEEIGNRLRLLINHIGMDTSVQITDKSAKQLKRYCDGAEPPFSVLKRLAEASGTTLEWIAYGSTHSSIDVQLDIQESEARLAQIERELRRRPKPAEEVRSRLRREADLQHQSIAVQRSVLKLMADIGPEYRHPIEKYGSRAPAEKLIPPSAEIDNAELIRIPRYNIAAAAGDGFVPVDEFDEMGDIVLARSFIRRLGGIPEQCHIIFARGESMLPTIPEGSLLLIDRSKVMIEDNAVFVFRVGEMLKVKRARWRIDQRLDLVSDNQLNGYPPETYSRSDLEFIAPLGRVICIMRGP